MDAQPAICRMPRPHLWLRGLRQVHEPMGRTSARTGAGAITPEGFLVPPPRQQPCSGFATLDGSWVSWKRSRGVNGPVPDSRLMCGPWDRTRCPQHLSLLAAERFSVWWLCQDLVCPLGSRWGRLL